MHLKINLNSTVNLCQSSIFARLISVTRENGLEAGKTSKNSGKADRIPFDESKSLESAVSATLAKATKKETRCLVSSEII